MSNAAHDMLVKAAVAVRLKRARNLVAACEYSLGRALSDGERRDLLKDNTGWSSDLIAAVVEAL